MVRQILNVGAILFSTALFLMGSGLLITLAPLRAHLVGFSDLAIGLLGSCYFAGFVAGCVVGPRVFARVGHVRTFAVAASLLAASVLALPIFSAGWAWGVMRAVNGFCIAGLYIALESWLNDRADNETRGRILSIYLVVNFSALIVGQWVLLVAAPSSDEVFSINAILFCLCLLPVCLTRIPQPEVTKVPRLAIVRLIKAAPVGVAGCATVGLANGAFWTLAPVYAHSLNFTPLRLALFMSTFIAGGALVQWPLGRLSDRLDRRWIIAMICVIASGCGLVLGSIGGILLYVPPVFFTFVFAMGALMLPLYSLSIAHSNDRLTRDEYLAASAALLLINALFSIPGPLLASLITSVAGPHALFLYTALVHAAMAFYTFNRMRVREPTPEEMREPFAPLPNQSSQAALPLDPRGPQQ